MYKTAVEIADQVLGPEAVERKRKERWISILTSGALGTAAGLALKNTSLRNLPSEIIGAGIGGFAGAELPRFLWKSPEEDANDPRWWRKDYSPVEHGLALGAGAGIGSAGGHLALKGLQSKGMLIPTLAKPFKGITGTIATMAIPSLAGYFGARQLMRMRDARRDAAAAAGNA